jgi:hypothetical protein
MRWSVSLQNRPPNRALVAKTLGIADSGSADDAEAFEARLRDAWSSLVLEPSGRLASRVVALVASTPAAESGVGELLRTLGRRIATGIDEQSSVDDLVTDEALRLGDLLPGEAAEATPTPSAS